MLSRNGVQMPVVDAPTTGERSLVGLGVLSSEVVMVMVMMSADSMSPVTARTHVFEALEAVVGRILAMQLEVQVIRVGRRHVDERAVGAVWAFRGVPAQIFQRRRARALRARASDGELRPTPLSARCRVPRFASYGTAGAALALGTSSQGRSTTMIGVIGSLRKDAVVPWRHDVRVVWAGKEIF